MQQCLAREARPSAHTWQAPVVGLHVPVLGHWAPGVALQTVAESPMVQMPVAWSQLPHGALQLAALQNSCKESAGRV